MRTCCHTAATAGCRVRDGSKAYAWKGMAVPAAWIEHPESMLQERSSSAMRSFESWLRRASARVANQLGVPKPALSSLQCSRRPQPPPGDAPGACRRRAPPADAVLGGRAPAGVGGADVAWRRRTPGSARRRRVGRCLRDDGAGGRERAHGARAAGGAALQVPHAEGGARAATARGRQAPSAPAEEQAHDPHLLARVLRSSRAPSTSSAGRRTGPGPLPYSDRNQTIPLRSPIRWSSSRSKRPSTSSTRTNTVSSPSPPTTCIRPTPVAAIPTR